MISLSDRKWGVFKITDIFILSLSSGDNQLKMLDAGNFPLVSSGSESNGVVGFIKDGDEKSQLYDGGKITVDMFGKAFVHNYSFFAVSHGRINILIPKYNANLALNIFMAKAIENSTKNKFSYNVMCSQERLARSLISLPMNSDKKPDFGFMERYIEERINLKRNDYIEYTKRQLVQIERERERVDSDAVEWRVFRIGDLFNIQRPAPRNKDDYTVGDINFVASGAVNNGVTKSCQPKDGEKLDDGNCLSISPVDGSCFYQPVKFLGRGGAGSSIILLYPKDGTRLNPYIGLSLARIIYQTTQKYTYGHMANKDGIARDKIMLPVDMSGSINYSWLEDKVMIMIRRKYAEYLIYLDSVQM